MRRVLADAAAEGQRLGGGGLHRGDPVLVGDRGVHRIAHALGGFQRAVALPAQAVRERPQPVVGVGQPGRLQQLRAAQRRGRQHGRPVGPDPFEDGGQPELDRLGHPLGPHQGHHVAVHVPADGAPGLDSVHVEPVRAPVLVPVAGRRHHDQPLPERLDRRVVFVAEALLEDVGHPPGGVQVQPAMIEQRRLRTRESSIISGAPSLRPPCLPRPRRLGAGRALRDPPRLHHPRILDRCFRRVKSKIHKHSSRTDPDSTPAPT